MESLAGPLIIGVAMLIALVPLATLLGVRLLIPLNGGAEQAGPPPPRFESLADLWAGLAPHLRELRNRMLACILALALGSAIGFWLGSDASPVGPLPVLIAGHFAPGVVLQGIDVTEVFVSYLRVALLVGFALALPVLIYQAMAFLAPALRPQEQRLLFSALPFLIELFLVGALFGWFVTVPAALDFLISFGIGGPIEVRPRLADFLGVVTTLVLWNGLIFELPAVIFLLARLGLVRAGALARARRYAIALIVVFAGLITPTGDPYNLLLLAVPMWLLYELGVLACAVRAASRSRAAAVARRGGGPLPFEMLDCG